MCVSALVEANGVHLESVLQAIAEQLPPLWERARESVPIHSCLLSGESRWLGLNDCMKYRRLFLTLTPPID